MAWSRRAVRFAKEKTVPGNHFQLFDLHAVSGITRGPSAQFFAGIDTWFDAVRELRRPDLSVVAPVHKRPADVFREISGLEMRSLASKYLRLHFPRAVYIYDERAGRATRPMKPRLRMKAPAYDRYETAYARFVQGCATIRDELEQLLGKVVTPREVDKVLLAVADRTT